MRGALGTAFPVDFLGAPADSCLAPPAVLFLFLPATSAEADSDLGGLPRRLQDLPAARVDLVLTTMDFLVLLVASALLSAAVGLAGFDNLPFSFPNETVRLKYQGDSFSIMNKRVPFLAVGDATAAREGRPLFRGVSCVLLEGAARLAGDDLEAETGPAAALILAARGGSLGNRFGRDAAAVSLTAALRVRFEEGSVTSAFAPAEGRRLGGMARESL